VHEALSTTEAFLGLSPIPEVLPTGRGVDEPLSTAEAFAVSSPLVLKLAVFSRDSLTGSGVYETHSTTGASV
jgi:hypothetical protein